MARHVLRVRTQVINDEGFTRLWLNEVDGAIEKGRLHGAMWSDDAEVIIKLIESGGVAIERDEPRPNTDAMTWLAHDTVEKTVEHSEQQRGLFDESGGEDE